MQRTGCIVATMTANAATLADPPHYGYRRLHFGSFLGLFCVGVYATSFGPALPFLAERYGVSLDRAGLLITALFAGSIAASGAITVYLHRFEPRLLASIGLVIIAVGAMGLAATSSWVTALVSVSILGAGDGLWWLPRIPRLQRPPMTCPTGSTGSISGSPWEQCWARSGRGLFSPAAGRRRLFTPG